MKELLEIKIRNLALSLYITKHVMKPSPYSLLSARFLIAESLVSKTVLDIGTGSGILAVIAAKGGAHRVWATDISSRALDVARQNAELNCVGKQIVTAKGSMFEPVKGEKFDLIICNPPSMPMKAGCKGKKYYYAGEDGRLIIDKLIQKSPDYLKSGSTLAFINTSLVDMKKTRKMLHAFGFNYKVVAKKRLQFRDYYFANLKWITALARQGKAEFEKTDGAYFENLYMIRAVLK